ncbi:Quinidine resistance protein 3 like [Verticillium longisporum]|nr:Quinidine resistance protein 3 like [Verticillium longisporum]
MTLIGLVLAWFYVPLDPPLEAQPKTSKHILAQFSPMPVFRVFEHINILAANITCGLLSFNQYGLLGSIRSGLTTRFGPSSPLTSGLFYLAPGAGFLIGSTIGGRLSDHTVRRYIKKRNGLRLPRDRLKSSFPAIFIVLPLGTLLFGWSLGREVGDWAAPGIGAFLAGLGLMASFSGLNTYSAEVLPAKKTEAISSKYIVQYTFAAGTVASRVPIMEAIGVGWAFTISAVAALAGGVIVLMITRYEPETEKTLREEAE